MSQPIETFEIPLEARKQVYLSRMSRTAGYLSALTIGFLAAKVPVRNAVAATAAIAVIDVVIGVSNAYSDDTVKEEMSKENFGTTQRNLEEASIGLGVGFGVIAAALLIRKFRAKKEETNDQ